MLPPALRRYIGYGSLNDFQQRLLYALAADITGNGSVFTLPGDLIDLIHIDDALFRPFHIKIRRLNQPEQNILHILAYVARLCERCGIRNGEGHIQNFGQSLRKQRLAAASGADQQDIAFLKLHIRLRAVVQPLIVVVHRHGKGNFCLFLTDNVLIHILFDGLRRRDGFGDILLGTSLEHLFAQNIVAQIHTLVTDIDTGTSDQTLDLILPLPTEGALDIFSAVFLGHERNTLSVVISDR